MKTSKILFSLLMGAAFIPQTLASGNSSGSEDLRFEPIRYNPSRETTRATTPAKKYPLFEDDLSIDSLVKAFDISCEYWDSRATKRVKVGGLSYTGEEIKNSLTKLKELLQSKSGQELSEAIINDFQLYRSVRDNGSNKAYITGFYELELDASAEQTDRYTYPIRGRILGDFNPSYPENLSKTKYRTIAWLRGPKTARLLRIEGSAFLKFPNGQELHVVAADSEASRWDIIPTDGGGASAIGGELIEGRSIAVDPRCVPLGVPAFLVSRKPENGSMVPFSRFVTAHDTGGRIKGHGRVDLFFGRGEEARRNGSQMGEKGTLYIMLLKK